MSRVAKHAVLVGIASCHLFTSGVQLADLVAHDTLAIALAGQPAIAGFIAWGLAGFGTAALAIEVFLTRSLSAAVAVLVQGTAMSLKWSHLIAAVEALLIVQAPWLIERPVQVMVFGLALTLSLAAIVHHASATRHRG